MMDDQPIQDLDAMIAQQNDPNANIFEQYTSKNDDDDMDDFESTKHVRKFDLSITYDFFH